MEFSLFQNNPVLVNLQAFQLKITSLAQKNGDESGLERCHKILACLKAHMKKVYETREVITVLEASDRLIW